MNLPNSITYPLFKFRRILYTPLFDLIKNQPVYIFHHIPKCGGTSMRNALNTWFNIKTDYEPPFTSKEYTRHKLNKYNLKRFKPYYCLVSHFECERISERYPEVFLQKDRYRVISFIRDPFDIAVSLYYYRKKMYPDNPKYNKISLKEHLLLTENFLALNFNCNENNYLQILDQYYFIGILEDVQFSFDLLAKKIKRPKIKFPRFNTTVKDKELLNLSDDIKKKFFDNNKLDYLIYEHIKQKNFISN